MRICPTHGAKNHKFCDECGAELVIQDNPGGDPKAPFKISGHKPCPECNFNLDHKHQDFCPGCGHKLKWMCR